MRIALVVLLLVLGVIFSFAVALMNPKGGLQILGGTGGGGHEYGSKKSFESVLKNTAYICGFLFVLVCVVLPFI